MKGITIGTYRAWKGREVSKAELRAKRDAQDARREADTYRKSTEAQDEASDLSDRAISERLRQRAER